MNFPEAVKFSFQALHANRLRTFLTTVGMIIGNASVILVVTISLYSRDLILDQIRGIGSNLVNLSSDAGVQNAAEVQGDYIKLADIQAIRDSLGNRIVAATAIMTVHDDIVVNGKVRQVVVDGIDEYYTSVRNLVILAGRQLDASDINLREHVAMLTSKLATRIFGSQIAAVGQTIRINHLQFTVVGTFREKTSTFNNSEIADETILIPVTILKYFVPYERVDQAWISVRNARDVPAASQEIEQIIRSRHRPGASYTVENLTAILDTANRIANVLTIVLVIVSTIALLISGIGIMNIMLVTVTERTREIGLRMAVGASRREVLLQFLVESVLISLIGGILGIMLGIALPLGISLFSMSLFAKHVAVPVSSLSVIVAFVVSCSVGIGFGLLPARRASQLNPTEALRYE
ncbi:MAG TPA: ABC transporter permease [Bryobacteraceae bacterium]|jgi:putative ABC transport system permease protein|nr:ABC transporter permease [Bryobacteraceae bacterium]